MANTIIEKSKTKELCVDTETGVFTFEYRSGKNHYRCNKLTEVHGGFDNWFKKALKRAGYVTEGDFQAGLARVRKQGRVVAQVTDAAAAHLVYDPTTRYAIWLRSHYRIEHSADLASVNKKIQKFVFNVF